MNDLNTEATVVRTATCCCGLSSIEIEGNPKTHTVCHCGNCKKRTGSAFGVSAYFADTQVKRKSEKTEIYKINTDTTRQERHFCKTCGTTLYWKIYRFPEIPGIAEMTGIAGGCFTDDPLPDPAITVSNEQKCTWLELPTLQIVDRKG